MKFLQNITEYLTVQSEASGVNKEGVACGARDVPQTEQLIGEVPFLEVAWRQHQRHTCSPHNQVSLMRYSCKHHAAGMGACIINNYSYSHHHLN